MYDKGCELYDRVCTNCGECSLCDLDQDKICDNCGKCIEDDRDYIKIQIEKIFQE